MTAHHDPPRPPLTRDRVLRAAVAYADRHGIAALSMRKLAAELGFEVMSLYNHVANKDDLLDGMTDLVAAEIDHAGAAGAAWRDAVRHLAISANRALLAHPWACTIWSSRFPGEHRVRLMESLLAAFARSGLPHDVAHSGYHAVALHIVGFSTQQNEYDFEPGEIDRLATDFLGRLPVDEFPHVAAHVREHLESPASGDEFTFALDLILDGLERLGTT